MSDKPGAPNNDQLKTNHGLLSHLARSILLFTCATLLLGSCSASGPSTRQINSPPTSGTSTASQTPTKQTSPSATFSGRVISVKDGDTIIVLDAQNTTRKTRLQ